MNLKYIFLSLFFCFFLNIETFACIFDFTWNEKEQIEFKLIDNLIVIELRINNSYPLNFILDSGVKNLIITELTPNDSLELNYAKIVNISGLGKESSVEAYYSVSNQIFIGSKKLDSIPIYILKNDILQLSKHMGYKVHGLIGYDFFKNFIIEIQYSNQYINFYYPKNYIYPKKYLKAENFPIIIENRKSYIYAKIMLESGDTTSGKFLIDTGGSLSLWLSDIKNKIIKIPDKNIDAYLGSGLSGDITGKIGRIKELHIGKYIHKNVVASFPDSASINYVVKSDNRIGTIGGEVLRRYNVLIDYTNKKISFRKNSNFYDQFTYNSLGFEIITPLPGFPVYEVLDVRKGSPADIADIKPGDKIMEIDDVNTFNIDINKIHELMHENKKRKIRIVVINREGEKIYKKLNVKDLL